MRLYSWELRRRSAERIPFVGVCSERASARLQKAFWMENMDKSLMTVAEASGSATRL
jgi:hypothetical protein